MPIEIRSRPSPKWPGPVSLHKVAAPITPLQQKMLSKVDRSMLPSKFGSGGPISAIMSTMVDVFSRNVVDGGRPVRRCRRWSTSSTNAAATAARNEARAVKLQAFVSTIVVSVQWRARWCKGRPTKQNKRPPPRGGGGSAFTRSPAWARGFLVPSW